MKKLMFILLMLWAFVGKGQEARLVLPVGHTTAVNAVKFSPDGRYLVSTSYETLKIWETSSAKSIYTLEGHSNEVNYAEFSPDGSRVLSASNDSTIKIWEVASGNLLSSLNGHNNKVKFAEFNSDGSLVLSISNDSTIKIWETFSGKLIESIKEKNYITSTHFSPDGKRIVSSSWETILIRETNSRKILHTLEGHTQGVSSVCFSLDGTLLLSTSDDGTAKIWESASGKLIHTLEGPGGVNSAKFSADGKYVLTISEGHLVPIWETASGNLKHYIKLDGSDGNVESAHFSPNGQYVVVTSSNGWNQTLKIWELSSAKYIHKLEKPHRTKIGPTNFSPTGNDLVSYFGGSIIKLEVASGKIINKFDGNTVSATLANFSPDGKRFITASENDNTLAIRELTGNLIQTLKGHTNSILSAGFSPDGQKVISGSFDNTAKIWETESGMLIHSLEEHYDYVSSVNFSPDGKKVVTGSLDNSSKIWDAASGKIIRTLEGHEGSVFSVNFSPDGNFIISASADNTVKIWDTDSGKLIRTHKGYTSWVYSANFSPDGKYFVSASAGTLKIRDAVSGKIIHELKGHNETVHSVKFSPDGKKIVSASFNETILIWDFESGKLINSISGHKIGVRSVEFSPDGNKIITTSWDHTVKTWGVSTGKLLYTFLQLQNNDWLVYDEHYRYDGSQGARDYLYFVCGLEVVDLAQVKDALYVPNLVQRIMNGENLDHLPKLKDLEICGLTPEVEPNDNKKDGGYFYNINARKGGVGKVEIYINGMLRQTVDSKTLTQKDGIYELKIEEKLIQQYQIADKETELKVIARTADNKISSRGAVARTTAKETVYRKPSLHAIMVGIDDYKGDGLDLNYAAKDAIDLQTALKISTQKLFNVDDTNRVHFYNLTLDRSGNINGLTPDRNNILKTLEKIEKESKPEDVFLLFFAGHGEINPEKQLILLTAEASKEQAPNYSGIMMKELLEKLAKIPAGKRILLLDACHSGAAINELNLKDIAGVRNGEDAEKQSQRLKELENLASKSGLAIITASSTDQKALELPQYEHGLMTYALLSTMLNDPEVLDKDNNLQLEDWLRQTEKNVSKLIENQSAQRFVPVNFSVGKVDDAVRKSIVLQEIPTVVVANVYNKELDDDNLDLKTQLVKKLNEISTRGGTDKIIIAEKDGPNAISVNLSYELIEGKIKSKITLKKDKKVFKQFNFEGIATDLNKFVEDLSKEITKNLK